MGLALAAVLGLGAAAVLLDDADQPRPVVRHEVAQVPAQPVDPVPLDREDQPSPSPSTASPVSSAQPAAGPANTAPPMTDIPSARAPRQVPSTPAGVMSLDQDEVDAATLAEWVQRAELSPPVRYAALRRLEQLWPYQAVEVARQRLEDPVPLIRTNALAVLARSRDPAAREVLQGLDARRREVAAAIASRR